jgi:pimeloyl-ACP methyl ester carboxylesterase
VVAEALVRLLPALPRALSLRLDRRARTVVALAPAGGWAPDDDSYRELLRFQRGLLGMVKAGAPHAEAILASREGRRRATELLTVEFEHIPVELLAHNLRGVAACAAGAALIDHALRAGFTLDAERIACPVRIVWGTEDRLLPWPSAAVRYRRDWLPHADWVELGGAGHALQLDVPLETAELILGFTRY